MPPDISNPSVECINALRIAKADKAALQRAISNWASIQAASASNAIDPALLAAVGIRESGFRNIPQVGGGMGRGIFQIDLGANPTVTSVQAYDTMYAANFAAGMLAANLNSLAARFPEWTSAQLLQATAASYNFGIGNIRGNPSAIDIGTTKNNYGSNVIGLMSCFK